MIRRLHSSARLVVLLLVVAFASACAAKTIRQVATANHQFATSLQRLQGTVTQLHDAGHLTDPSYQSWQVGFKKLAQAGQALNEALRQSDGQGATAQIRVAVDAVDQLIRDQVITVRPEHQLAVAIGLESVRSVLISMSVAVED